MFGCSSSRAVETISSTNVAAAEETPSVWYGLVQLLSIPADSEFFGGAAFAEVRSGVGPESLRARFPTMSPFAHPSLMTDRAPCPDFIRSNATPTSSREIRWVISAAKSSCSVSTSSAMTGMSRSGSEAP